MSAGARPNRSSRKHQLLSWYWPRSQDECQLETGNWVREKGTRVSSLLPACCLQAAACPAGLRGRGRRHKVPQSQSRRQRRDGLRWASQIAGARRRGLGMMSGAAAPPRQKPAGSWAERESGEVGMAQRRRLPAPAGSLGALSRGGPSPRREP